MKKRPDFPIRPHIVLRITPMIPKLLCNLEINITSHILEFDEY